MNNLKSLLVGLGVISIFIAFAAFTIWLGFGIVLYAGVLAGLILFGLALFSLLIGDITRDFYHQKKYGHHNYLCEFYGPHKSKGF